MLETTQAKLNLTPTREHKVKSDYGVKDYFSFYRKNYTNLVNNSVYRKVLRSMNKKLAYKIATIPYDLKIPRAMGIMKVRKYYPEFRILPDGTYKNKMAINFKETLNLWEEDGEAKELKIKIYYENEHSDGFIFRIHYDKWQAKYSNKSCYCFRPNRGMKSLLGNNIKNKNIDAFLS